MINEEDHLRCIDSLGPAVEKAFSSSTDRQRAREQIGDFAFDPRLGTDCRPTNVGTGMRASAMLHLPARPKRADNQCSGS